MRKMAGKDVEVLRSVGLSHYLGRSGGQQFRRARDWEKLGRLTGGGAIDKDWGHQRCSVWGCQWATR